MSNDRRPPARPQRPARPERPPIPQAIFISPNLRPTADDDRDDRQPQPTRGSREGALKMTKSASEAARRAGLDDDALRRVISEPSEVSPDRDHPDRTRFTRGPVVVVVARDGVVLGVYKR